MAALQQSQLSEIKAIASASEALYASKQGLEALVQAIKAKQKLQQVGQVESKLEHIDGVERQSTQTFVGHNGVMSNIAGSSDSQFFASAGMDATVKLWSRDGELITTLLGHSASVWHLAIASDGSFLASVGDDNTLIIWNLPRKKRT